MKASRIKLLVFAVPFIFVFIGFLYQDPFYFFAALITLLIGTFMFVSKKGMPFSSKLKYLAFDFQKMFHSLKRIRVKRKKVSKPHSKKKYKFQFRNEIINPVTLLSFSLFSILSAATTIFLLPTQESKSPLVLQYYTSFLQFFVQYHIALLASLVVLLLVFIAGLFLTGGKKSIKTILKIAAIRLAVYLCIFIVSLHVGLGLALMYAFGQVSYITYGYNKGFVQGKVITDPQAINKAILSSRNIPHFAYYKYNYKKGVVLLKLNNKKGFYGDVIVTNLPDSLYKAINVPQVSMMLVDNNLLITELKEDSLEEISPAIGKILVKSTFTNKNIKDEPNVTLLNRQEYLRLREKQINKEVKKLDERINEIDTEIAQAQGYIAEGKRNLQEAQDFLANAASMKEVKYNECKTAGETYMGEFYRYYTDDQCNSLRAQYDKAVGEVSGKINSMQANISHNQQVLSGYQSIRSQIADTRDFVDATKNSTPYELGIFLPKKEIKIALDSNNPDAFNAYLATLVHEYLHYTSYISEERTLDHFFEEALTEYFARKVIKKQLNYKENLGYPVAVKLITEITKKVPEDKLLKIYYTKDQKQLEYLLDEAYGKDFYSDSKLFFATINYLPLDESLKTANTIMLRIDGKKLSKSDIE